MKMRFSRSKPEERTVDGIVFDSKPEAAHYAYLKMLQKAGKIHSLQYEPQFVFIVNGVEVGRFKPDFQFIETETNQVKIHEVKGWRRSKKTGKLLPRVDKGYTMRAKLMLACFGLTVELT
jgi:hypothetical protein